MRVSSYLIGAPLPNQPFHILLHGYTGALDKVPSALGEFLLERRGHTCRLDEGPLARLSNAERSALAARGYLTAQSQGEERALLIRLATHIHDHNLRSFNTGFIFVPTYRCNLRCPYCFQPHTMHSGRGAFAQVMNEEQVAHGFAIIDQLRGPGAMAAALGLITRDEPVAASETPIDIGLFGGEPLAELTVPIVRRIVDLAEARGATVSAITNGVDLALFADLLAPNRLRELQITLDGTAQLHNRYRIGPGLHQTFERITDNIQLALDCGVQVNVRLNVDATNFLQIEALNDLFERRGWARHPNFGAHAASVTPEGATRP